MQCVHERVCMSAHMHAQSPASRNGTTHLVLLPENASGMLNRSPLKAGGGMHARLLRKRLDPMKA